MDSNTAELTFFRKNMVMMTLSSPQPSKSGTEMKMYISMSPYSGDKQKFDYENRINMALNLTEVGDLLNALLRQKATVKSQAYHTRKDGDKEITTTMSTEYNEAEGKMTIFLKSSTRDKAIFISLSQGEQTAVREILRHDLPYMRGTKAKT